MSVEPSTLDFSIQLEGEPAPNTQGLRDAYLLACRLLHRVMESSSTADNDLLGDNARKVCELLDSFSIVQCAVAPRPYLRRDISVACHQASRILKRVIAQDTQEKSQPHNPLHPACGPADPELLAVLLCVARIQLERGKPESLQILLEDPDTSLCVDKLILIFNYLESDARRNPPGRDGMFFVHNFLFGTGGTHRIRMEGASILHELLIPYAAASKTTVAGA